MIIMTFKTIKQTMIEKDLKRTNHGATTLSVKGKNAGMRPALGHLLSMIFLISLVNNKTDALASSASKPRQQQQQPKFIERGPQNQDYFYARTRSHPNHLRISEDFKNSYIDEVKFESTINGTKWHYHRANQVASFDELVFETIDKIFRHRLSPFYIYHYDNEADKRRSSDQRRVSPEVCARDLLYLVDKLHGSCAKFGSDKLDDNHMAPELAAFFDSYARPESGVLMGNTYWVGGYDQCVKRHIFDLIDEPGAQKRAGHEALTSPDGVTSRLGKQQVVSFQGRYCVASLKSPIWDRLIAERKLKSKHYFKTKNELNNYAKLFRLQMGICLPDSCDSSSFERHNDEIKLLTQHALDSSPRYSHYKLVDLYCMPDEGSPLRQWSYSAIGFFLLTGAWSLSIILATLADWCEFVDLAEDTCTPQRRKNFLVQMVGWLSLRANYNKLMQISVEEQSDERKENVPNEKEEAAREKQCAMKEASESSPEPASGAGEPRLLQRKGSRVECSPANNPCVSEQTPAANVGTRINLKFLNAFKVLVMFWIVNGHIMLLMIQTAKNILDSDALLNGFMHTLIGATFGVDLFFTMTGFLTAYLLFNSGHARKMRPGAWLYLTFHRYWRLAPMYLLTFWFSRSVMQLLGSGPLWDYGTSAITFRGLCNQESWWYPLTLTSNLHGLFDECLITSWYISCDMQFWLVSPIFLHLLAHHPLAGWLASLATIGGSSLLRYQSVLNDKSARYDELVKPRADIFMRVSHDLPALYTLPHFRISAYIVGLLAGHYVYMIKSGLWRTSLIPSSQQGQAKAEAVKGTVAAKTDMNRAIRYRNILAYTGLVIFTLMSFASYLTANFYPASWIHLARDMAACLYAFDHLMMSFGVCLIIITMCLGQWPRLTSFLSHPNWTRLSKINYALLLLQCEVIYFQIFRYEQMPVAGTRELLNILFNLLVTLYPIAFVITLFFEFPLANVEKLLLGSLGATRSKNNKAGSDPGRNKPNQPTRASAEENFRLNKAKPSNKCL